MAKSRKKKDTGSGGKLLVLLIAVILLAAAVWQGWMKFGPSREHMSREDLFNVSGDHTAVMYEYELQQAYGLTREGEVYLPYPWVKTILNRRFYWDDEEKLLIYVIPDKALYLTEQDRGEDGKKLFLVEDGKAWISAALIEKYTDIRIERFLEEDVKRIFLSTPPEEDAVYDAGGKTVLRSRKSWKGLITADIPKGSKLREIPDHPGSGEQTEEQKKWQRVMTEEGITGYIRKGRLKNARTEAYADSFRAQEYPSLSLGKPVVLGWHQVTVDQANKYLEDLLQVTQGLNVVSPTWFTLKGNSGEYESRVSTSYVEKAHSQGLQVWALVDNLDSSVTLGTLLERTSVRKKLIGGLVEEASAAGVDGINLDFEMLRKDAVDQYLEFVREMYVACHEKNLILSVDVPNYATYNWHYERNELAVFCDYVINMGYDEHTTGDEAGSTASIGFFRSGIEDSLREVPAEKLIGGIPFYTRVWRVEGDQTTSEALTMKGAAEWIEKNSVKLIWDEELGQYRGHVTGKDGAERYIWMENARSLELKVDALKEYGTAGIACWKLGQETADVWDLIGGFGNE